MARWVDVCGEAEVAVSQARRVTVAGQEIALFHQPDGWYALEDACPHRGGALHEGFVDDGEVACPIHLWRFRLTDGACTSFPAPRAETFPVRVQAGRVWVRLDEAAPGTL